MSNKKQVADKNRIKGIVMSMLVWSVFVVIFALLSVRLPVTLSEAGYLKQIVSGEGITNATVYGFGLKLWMKIMGCSLLRMRLFSLGCIVASLLTILLVGRAWFGEKIGILGGMLFGGALLYLKAGIYVGPFAFRVFCMVVVAVLLLTIIKGLPAFKGKEHDWSVAGWVPVVLAIAVIVGAGLWIVEGEGKRQQVAEVENWNEQTASTMILYYDSEELLPLYEYYLPGKQFLPLRELDYETVYPEYAYLLSAKKGELAQEMVQTEEITTSEVAGTTLEKQEIAFMRLEWGYGDGQELVEQLTQLMAEHNTKNIMVSMYPMENYALEHFNLYLGIDVARLDSVLDKGTQLTGLLKQMLEENADMERVYIGLEPEEMGEGYVWDEELMALIRSRETVKFYFLLSYPKVATLAEMSLEEYEHYKGKLTEAVNYIASAPNAHIHYVGAQEWLTVNEDNYADEERLQDDVARNIFALTWVDGKYQVKADNMEAQLRALDKLVENYKAGSYVFKDWSDYHFVYLGDSVVGNYGGPCSIPGVVSYFTNANYYNCAVGGLSATTSDVGGRGINTALDVIFEGGAEVFSDKPQAESFMRMLYEDGWLTEEKQGENLIFFINFGLNDYYGGYEVGTVTDTTEYNFLGSLRTAIERLRERCPKAQIVLMTPNPVYEFGYGTEPQNDIGEVLEDFVTGMKALAVEMDVPCLDTYVTTGITRDNMWELVADGTHPNEQGRFVFATRIAEYLDSIR